MKTKDANALLGKMIKHMSPSHDISASKVTELSRLDDYSTSVLLSELASKRFIITSMDKMTVTDLGIINYISPLKRFLTHYLVLGIKELFVFISGVAIGLTINYITHLLGW